MDSQPGDTVTITVDADEANNVSIHTDLRWASGPHKQSHGVYMGTDFNDINHSNTTILGIFKDYQDSNSHDPGLLEVESLRAEPVASFHFTSSARRPPGEFPFTDGQTHETLPLGLLEAA